MQAWQVSKDCKMVVKVGKLVVKVGKLVVKVGKVELIHKTTLLGTEVDWLELGSCTQLWLRGTW
jgi:hypothetical protein